MKKMLTSCLLAVSALLPLNATAAGQLINGQIVSYIGTGWGAEGFYIQTVANNTVGNCGPRFFMELTHPMKSEMLSILLSAYHSGEKVDLYVDGCLNSDAILKAVAIVK